MGNELKDDEIKFLLERLGDAFEGMTGISLTNSEKAVEHIMWHKKDSSGKISSRFLRDYWPSGAKTNKKGENEPVERKSKKLSDFKSSKTINKLDLIADCAGYSSWEAFVRITKRNIVTENTFYDPKDFNVKKMSPGDVVTIGWYPQYFMKLQYLGNYKFKILSFSYNLKHRYQVGDELEIYGVAIRYGYELGRPLDDVQNDKKKEHNPNLSPKYVGGCSLYPELCIVKKKDNIPLEENIYVFLVSSLSNNEQNEHIEE